jgi:hypothetical protein
MVKKLRVEGSKVNVRDYEESIGEGCELVIGDSEGTHGRGFQTELHEE